MSIRYVMVILTLTSSKNNNAKNADIEFFLSTLLLMEHFWTLV